MEGIDAIVENRLLDFRDFLFAEERAAATVEKYIRDIRAFYRYLPEEKAMTRENVLLYKHYLGEKYKTASANSMLAALNQFLAFIHKSDLRVKLFRVQRSAFREQKKELTKEEYIRLVRTAKLKKNERLSLLLQAICSTGIRVSEHRFITWEALKRGRVVIVNKGKERTVLLPEELRRQLVNYCSSRGIVSGPVFITRTGKPLNRCNIWAEMKSLCASSGVSSGKVFPHNLRHLFALTYYKLEKDIVRLADILGHSNIETTRVYTFTSGEEHMKALAKLHLLL